MVLDIDPNDNIFETYQFLTDSGHIVKNIEGNKFEDNSNIPDEGTMEPLSTITGKVLGVLKIEGVSKHYFVYRYKKK